MDRIQIRGGPRLSGKISIGGAKNAALPLMMASLLTDEDLVLRRIPDVSDITSLATLLRRLGVELQFEDIESLGGLASRSVTLACKEIATVIAPYELVRKMRASILVLGPLLARCGRARVSLPGGCAIGTRPVNFHLAALEQLGAKIELEDGDILATVPNGLHGVEVHFPDVSVGATENLMMAACLADGETVLRNAAREPEVGDLACCLSLMGAKIEGVGSDVLRITGVPNLHGTVHDVLPDRIETGTYVMAAAITDGDIELVGARCDLIASVTEKLSEAGVEIEPTKDGMRVRRRNKDIYGIDILTQPYPGFPTDLQAQAMALMTISQGASMITETIFENRFMHVAELNRMGARITVHGTSAMIRGVPSLTGAPVMATDLRASVSLIIAGLVANGETTINRVYHLDRGYQSIEDKLASCGANITRLRD